MLAIAHITDIHISGELDPILPRAERVGAAIASNLSEATSLVILLTGDIAYSGLQSQYELALTFLKRIEERVAEDFNGDVIFVACPGNHDCDFTGPQDVRNLVLRQISEKPGADVGDQLLDSCLNVQSAFFDFLDRLSGLKIEGRQRLRYSRKLDVDGEQVVFDCLNVAWVSQLSEDKVTFPATILPAAKSSEGCVITALHHPLNWLHPSSYRDFRRRVRSNSDFLFSGHEHESNVTETEDRESGGCIHFEGSVLQETTTGTSGFSLVELDLIAKRYRVFEYQWGGSAYIRQNVGAWGEFRRFSLTPPADSWVVTHAFDRELSDLGVTLRVGGRSEVGLEDVFVFPDLEASSEEEDVSEVVQCETLISGPANAAGFVLQGDDRSGRTSLLKHLFRRFYDKGFVPLFVSAEQIVRATVPEIEDVLGRNLVAQYDKSLPQYLQLPSNKRVLIVDDFDGVPIRSEKARAQVLCRLRARCGVLVLSVADVFEAAHLVEYDDGRAYESLPKYRVMPFGRLSRAKLISRWVTIDTDEFLSEEERIRRIDEATKYVDAVVRSNVVPRYPVYLLTLLQAHKAGSPESFKDSGLGHYYQYLISDAMLKAGVDKGKLTDVEQYCTQLAWWMRGLRRAYVSQDELGDFNRDFADRWVTLDFRAVLDQLLRSCIIRKVGSVLEFRYSYIYYFFVARYLAENFDDPAVQSFINEAVGSLYVRSNANVLVFLTHFANKSSVVDAIVCTLNEQFCHAGIAQFAVRNESVEAMLRSLPAVVYEGGKPEEHRERVARQIDESRGDSVDGLRDHAEVDEELSLSARLTIVFKTVEILGQILKTQYSRILRPRREEIILDMLNGPLRALEDFYSALLESPESLVAEFEARLADEKGELSREDRRSLAQKVVGSIVLAVTFSFIRKASEAVGSEAIAEDLRAVASGSQQLGHSLIRLAAQLDGQRPLPRVDIEEIQKQGAKSLIVQRVVQVLVVYHMYMFQTSYEDIRWAHDILGIPNRMKLQVMLDGGIFVGPNRNKIT